MYIEFAASAPAGHPRLTRQYYIGSDQVELLISSGTLRTA